MNSWDEFFTEAHYALARWENGGSNMNPIVWVHPLSLRLIPGAAPYKVGQPMTAWGRPVKFCEHVPRGEVRVVRDAVMAGS